MIKRILFSVLSMYLLFVMSCNKASDNPPAVITEGYLKGSVNLFDEGLVPLSKDSMKVSLENTDPEIFVFTDTNGDFIFENLDFDIYTIAFAKENYGTFKFYGLNHSGSNTNVSVVPSLGEKSSTEITLVDAFQFETDILVNVSCTPAASVDNPRYIRYFLGLTSGVSSSQYMYSSMVVVADSDPVVITLTQQELNNIGFASSSEVFIRVYGDSYWSNMYEQPDGTTIFPNLNPTTVDVVSFIVP